MRPTEFVDLRQIKPSIPEMIRVAMYSGADRLSMVREGKPGICILMIGNRAIREIGPYLERHVSKLLPHSCECILADPQETLQNLFTAMEVTGREWSYIYLEVNGVKHVACLIVGNSITAAFAQDLTLLGCITNLR